MACARQDSLILSGKRGNGAPSANQDLKRDHGDHGERQDYGDEIARSLLQSVRHELGEDHPDHGPRREPEPVG